MKLFDILLPYQKKFILDKSRFKILLCARQVGKSFTLAAQAVIKSLLKPRNLTAIVSTGERAANELLKKVIQWAEASKVYIPDISFTNNATSVTFNNKSRIIVLPAGNPAALRGFSGDIILDEFAIVENDSEIWQAIMPSITNTLAGEKSITIASTPSPGLNTLDTIFAQIWNSNDNLWSKHFLDIYQAKEQGLNVNIDEIKKVVDDDITFQIEFLCKFISDKTSAFKESDFDINLVENVKENNDNINILGYDVARNGDNSAIVIGNLNINEKLLNILDITILNKMPYEEQINILKDLNKKYKIRFGLIDATGIGGPVSEYIAKNINALIKPFVWTSSNKSTSFENLRKYLNLKTLRFSNEKLLTMIKNDCLNVRRIISSSGKIIYEARHSKNGHADICSALVLLTNILNEKFDNINNEKTFKSVPINKKFAYKKRF